eukprot:258016-Rhodomonas_salina.3
MCSTEGAREETEWAVTWQLGERSSKEEGRTAKVHIVTVLPRTEMDVERREEVENSSADRVTELLWLSPWCCVFTHTRYVNLIHIPAHVVVAFCPCCNESPGSVSLSILTKLPGGCSFSPEAP